MEMGVEGALGVGGGGVGRRARSTGVASSSDESSSDSAVASGSTATEGGARPSAHASSVSTSSAEAPTISRDAIVAAAAGGNASSNAASAACSWARVAALETRRRAMAAASSAGSSERSWGVGEWEGGLENARPRARRRAFSSSAPACPRLLRSRPFSSRAHRTRHAHTVVLCWPTGRAPANGSPKRAAPLPILRGCGAAAVLCVCRPRPRPPHPPSCPPSCSHSTHAHRVRRLDFGGRLRVARRGAGGAARQLGRWPLTRRQAWPGGGCEVSHGWCAAECAPRGVWTRQRCEKEIDAPSSLVFFGRCSAASGGALPPPSPQQRCVCAQANTHNHHTGRAGTPHALCLSSPLHHAPMRPAELPTPPTLHPLDAIIAGGCDVLFSQYSSLVSDARAAASAVAASASPPSGRPARRRKLDPAADGTAVLQELGLGDLVDGGSRGGSDATVVAPGEGWRALRALRRAATPRVGLRRCVCWVEERERERKMQARDVHSVWCVVWTCVFQPPPFF